MTALARLRAAIVSPELPCVGLDLIEAAYPDAVRECRERKEATIRESWLIQESNRAVKAINLIRAKLVFARDENLSVACLNRQLAKEERALAECRAELERIRGAV